MSKAVGNCARIEVAPEAGALKDKCVVVVGASSGIGLSLAKILVHEHDALLIATGRSKEKTLESLLGAGIPQRRIKAAFGVDLSVSRSVEAFIRELTGVINEDCFFGVPIVFLQAGMMHPFFGDVESLGEEGIDTVFRANFIGFNQVASSLSALSSLKTTKFVITSSTNHFGGQRSLVLSPLATNKSMSMSTRTSYYASSKAACQALVWHLRSKGIWAVSVTPGAVITGLVSNLANLPSTYWFAYAVSPILFLPDEGAHYTLLAAFVKSPRVGDILVPYYIPPFALVSSEKLDGSLLYQAVAIALFEFTQRLTARVGFLWECPEAPFIGSVLYHDMKPLYFKW